MHVTDHDLDIAWGVCHARCGPPTCIDVRHPEKKKKKTQASVLPKPSRSLHLQPHVGSRPGLVHGGDFRSKRKRKATKRSERVVVMIIVLRTHAHFRFDLALTPEGLRAEGLSRRRGTRFGSLGARGGPLRNRTAHATATPDQKSESRWLDYIYVSVWRDANQGCHKRREVRWYRFRLCATYRGGMGYERKIGGIPSQSVTVIVPNDNTNEGRKERCGAV